MKKKNPILKFKKFTIASIGLQNQLIGAGQTNNGECSETYVAELCRTYEPNTSCTSSTRIPVSDARAGCASNIGGGD